MRQNLCVFSLYCNPDLDDLIFYCLLASMAAMQTGGYNLCLLVERGQASLVRLCQGRLIFLAFRYAIISSFLCRVEFT